MPGNLQGECILGCPLAQAYSPLQVDRIWLWVYCIIRSPYTPYIFYLPKGDESSVNVNPQPLNPKANFKITPCQVLYHCNTGAVLKAPLALQSSTNRSLPNQRAPTYNWQNLGICKGSSLNPINPKPYSAGKLGTTEEPLAKPHLGGSFVGSA